MTDKKKKDNPGNPGPPVDPVLCAAYREVLKNEITGLKDDMKKIDNRLFYILASIIINIILVLISNLI